MTDVRARFCDSSAARKALLELYDMGLRAQDVKLHTGVRPERSGVYPGLFDGCFFGALTPLSLALEAGLLADELPDKTALDFARFLRGGGAVLQLSIPADSELHPMEALEVFRRYGVAPAA